jgi:hypothetical protein
MTFQNSWNTWTDNYTFNDSAHDAFQDDSNRPGDLELSWGHDATLTRNETLFCRTTFTVDPGILVSSNDEVRKGANIFAKDFDSGKAIANTNAVAVIHKEGFREPPTKPRYLPPV